MLAIRLFEPPDKVSSMYSILGKLNTFKLLNDRDVNDRSRSLKSFPFSMKIASVIAFGL